MMYGIVTDQVTEEHKGKIKPGDIVMIYINGPEIKLAPIGEPSNKIDANYDMVGNWASSLHVVERFKMQTPN